MEPGVKSVIRRLLGPKLYHNIAISMRGRRERRQIAGFFASDAGRRTRERLIALKDHHKGKRAFIIGNGPSLNKMDLSRLKDEVTIGSNGIFLALDRLGGSPTYYTIEDQLVAEDRNREAAQIPDTQRIYPLDLKGVLDEAGAPIWVPFRRNYSPFPQFGTDLSECAYWGGTVTFFNIQLAFFLGCDPIYIIGCDHNYVLKGDEAVEGARITSTSDDINHFHPDYFGKGYRWHDPNVARMETAYLLARDVARQHGRSIYNATVGGHLEVFERKNFDSLFAR